MNPEMIIIVPAHNRQQYLNRIGQYYSNFPYEVYICDSSEEKFAMLKYDNIHYQWMPGLNFFEKILKITRMVESAFYALAPNDDFLKIETIEECLTIMKTDSTYKLGTGYQVFFNEPFDGCLFSFKSANKLRGFNRKSFENREAYVKYFWTNYQNILWSVYENNTFVSIFSNLAQMGVGYGNMLESVAGIESLRRGNVYVSDNPLNFREHTVSEHWGKIVPPLTIHNLKKYPKLQHEVDNVLNYYNKLGEKDFAEFCFNSYLEAHSSSCLYSRVKTNIVSYIPQKIKNIINWMLSSLLLSKKMKSYNDNVMLDRIKNAITDVRS